MDLQTVKRRFVDGPYGQVHVRISNPGDHLIAAPPLICLHMFPQSGRNFDAFLPIAAQRRIVVAPDFPGHGESAVPPQPISAEDYAASIWSALDALPELRAAARFDLFGVHAGSKLTAQMTCQSPHRVRKIVLSSPAVFSAEEVAQMQASFSPIPLDTAGTRFQRQWDMVVRSRDREMSLEMCATAFAEMMRGGEAYEMGHEAVFAFNQQFADVLSGLDHPVLVLNPGDELYDITPRALDHLANARLVDLPDWKHGFLDVRPQAVADIVLPWLDDRTP